MRKYLDTVQKQIGLLIASIGMAVTAGNFVDDILHDNNTVWEAVTDYYVWLVLLFTIPFIVSVFVENAYLKKLQVLIFFLVGTLNILTAFQEFFGPAMFLAAWLLMRHYGYLEKHARSKNVAILVVVTALSQISANLHSDMGLYAGVSTLLYTLFLVILLAIIWRDMVRQQKMLRNENFSLKMDYRKLSEQLKALEEDHKPFDLKVLKISPAEERVIRTLTVYKASNREIAERLNIAESTVKLHMYNICNKIGVDNRFAVIDLCKYNFEVEPVPEVG